MSKFFLFKRDSLKIIIYYSFLFIFTFLILISPKFLFNKDDIELIRSEVYYNEITLFLTSIILFFSQLSFSLSGIVYVILILTSLFLRYGEIYHYQLFGFGYEPISFSHFNKNSIFLFLDSYLFYFIIFSIILLTIVLTSHKIKIKFNIFFTIFLLFFSLRGYFLISSWGGLQHTSQNRIYSSEISAISAWRRYFTSYNFNLNNEEEKILNEIYSKNETKSISKRNIFLIYLESFSHKFLSEKISPNIYEFSKKSFVFENYFNASTPTINAIISSQCGIFPQLGYGIKAGYQAITERYNSLQCLGDTLKSSGYFLMYMQAADKSFSNKDSFLENHGFDIIYGRDEIKKLYNNLYQEESNFWGIYDRQLFEIATKELPKLKQKSPFLFSLITINTHSPGYFSKECPIQSEEKMLNGIKCTDFYLGKYLLEIKHFFPDAIIILTGDHVAGPNNSARKYVEDERIYSSYDRTLLIIYDPNNEKQVNTSILGITPDLYPTILDLLEGNDAHINFGKSLLSARKNNQNIITPEFQLNSNFSDFPQGNSFGDCFDEKLVSGEYIHHCTRKRIFNFAEKILFPM